MLFLANRYQADVLCVDYRGYGFSPATFVAHGPKLVRVEADALAVFDYLAARSPGKAIVAVGYSLGTIFATHVAANRPVAGVVLRAPGTSVKDMADAFLESLPWYERMWVKVDVEPELVALHPQPIDDIGNVHAPLLIVHGTRDSQVPFALGEKLFAAATAAREKHLHELGRAAAPR